MRSERRHIGETPLRGHGVKAADIHRQRRPHRQEAQIGHIALAEVGGEPAGRRSAPCSRQCAESQIDSYYPKPVCAR